MCFMCLFKINWLGGFYLFNGCYGYECLLKFFKSVSVKFWGKLFRIVRRVLMKSIKI